MTWRTSRAPADEHFAATGHRHLAARVIDQAFRDVHNPTGSDTDRASARAFLSGSRMLYYWCQIADLDPLSVIALARTTGKT